MTQTLNKFEVTNCTTKVTPDTLNLAISLKRLSGPFWHSLFVPSICLILAAEVTLFIDEENFEVLLMVSLTSNLVMYTMYSAIEEKLPDNSSFKLIHISINLCIFLYDFALKLNILDRKQDNFVD